MARQPLPEQLDAGVALLDVAEHPRHDAPPVEGRAIRGDRALVAGAGGDVGEGLGPHTPPRGVLEAIGVERDPRSAAADAVEIDCGLTPHADHAAASQHT